MRNDDTFRTIDDLAINCAFNAAKNEITSAVFDALVRTNDLNAPHHCTASMVGLDKGIPPTNKSQNSLSNAIRHLIIRARSWFWHQ